MTRLKLMNRFIRSLLFWTSILCACSTSLSTTEAAPLTPLSPPANATELTSKNFPNSPILPNGNEVIITPTYEGCGYQWAYKDMPEINKSFDKAIKALNPEAKAWATAFGENCVYADGHVTFGAMETDFYVHVPASDLSDFESFGNWIAQVMNTVEGLPDDLIVGPNPGFVEFWFITNDAEHVIVRVPIQKYREQAAGKSGEELFRLFNNNP